MYKHGFAARATRTGLYLIWCAMRARCTNPRVKSYRNYGGRGIRVRPEWDDFERFRADMGPRPPGTMLERIDNNGDYGPHNCRWATRSEQMRNRRPLRVRNLAGLRSGFLTVLSLHSRTSRRIVWECRCDCGEHVFVRSDHLKGKTKSCGCLQRRRASEVLRRNRNAHVQQ